jgi:site-specific DNA-cytosine methylase
MTFGKDIFCHGIEPYNFRDTDETVATITANVGQSTAIGPKVAIRKFSPFPSELPAKNDGVMGTIDAHIYLKNNNQDNSKYIIRKKNEMDQKPNYSIATLIEKFYTKEKGVDILRIIESLIGAVKEGVITTDEMVKTITDIKVLMAKKDESGYVCIAEAIKDIKRDAPHQQDQLNCQEEGEEMCSVRRLIPTETSTLQGFPKDYTKIDGPDTSDAPQYKSHGNSWATPCANHMSTRMEMEMRRLGHKGTIKYATCCSGIEAQSVAVKNLDWQSTFFSEIEPFPCRVLEHHYPKTPNLGDMTQIHYDSEKGVITNSHAEGEEYFLPKEFKVAPIQEIPFKEGDLQVFSGGTPCFARGVCVLTRTGYKPIENIKVGDEVATHKGRFRKVSKIGKKLSSDLVEVSIVGRSRFVCTADHPFPLLRSHRRKSGKIYFDSPILMPIKDGQSLYVQMVNAGNEDFGVAIPQLPRVYNASNSEIYELCGWYVGDGYIRGWKGKSKKAIILCLNAKDIAVFNERFAGKINYTILKSAGIFKVQICCTEFARFLHNHFGELAHGKKIPMWDYNKEVR